jgi:recombination protein RecR
MDRAPDQIDALIAQMARLPGLGPRSAKRAVLHLLQRRDQSLRPLLAALERVAQSAQTCQVCGNIGTAPVCDICTDPKRATGEICVVDDVGSLWAMERGRVFRGRYHVLGGTLSALDAVGPDDLRIPELVDACPHRGGARSHPWPCPPLSMATHLTPARNQGRSPPRQRHRGPTRWRFG